jgi:cell division protein ZapA (FtsZ GTPase activity inhibitor)
MAKPQQNKSVTIKNITLENLPYEEINQRELDALAIKLERKMNEISTKHGVVDTLKTLLYLSFDCIVEDYKTERDKDNITMVKEEKTKFIKQSFIILEQLAEDIKERVANAKEGVAINNNNLTMGGLMGIETTAQHLKNIYEAMLYAHQKM